MPVSFHTASPAAGSENNVWNRLHQKILGRTRANVRAEFGELVRHLRDDIKKIEEPKAQALFETAAEVIGGLETAFKHYEEKSEDAWK
jgi:hypothetical protein